MGYEYATGRRERFFLDSSRISLVNDPLRQNFQSVFAQENDGRVPDQVQMIKHLIDKGVDVDERTEDGLSALDILIDPQHYIATHAGTVMALLENGASVKPENRNHFQIYASGRLYGEATREIAQLFHARRTLNPIYPIEMGNFYHLLADGHHQEFVLINPMLHMVSDRDGHNLPRDEVEMYSQWLTEIRPTDGNDPVMLSWEKTSLLLDNGPQEEVEAFEQYSLGALWQTTRRYIDMGGDVFSKNNAGVSIADHIERHVSFLSAAQWEYSEMTPEASKSFLADIHAKQLLATTHTPKSRGQTRPRI